MRVDVCQETSLPPLSDQRTSRIRAACSSKARREVAFYRDVLKRIAVDLEQAAKDETDPQRRRWFDSRAARVREHLLRGMPEDWTEPGGLQSGDLDQAAFREGLT